MKDFKLDKHEVKKPDAFLKLMGRIAGFLSHHKTALISGIAAVVIGFAGFGVYLFYHESREHKAQEALFLARKMLRPELSTPLGQQPPAGAKKTLTPEAVKEFELVMTDFPKSRAAVVASIELSQAFLEEGKAAEAVAALKKVEPRVGSSEILFAMYKYQLGKVLTSSGQCEEAMPHLSSIASATGAASVFKSGALLQTGLCYEAMKQPAKAMEVYERVSKEFAEGASAESAKKYLRLLKRNTKT
jgi:predicted negative regulator of RcsB-dependent stress response